MTCHTLSVIVHGEVTAVPPREISHHHVDQRAVRHLAACAIAPAMGVALRGPAFADTYRYLRSTQIQLGVDTPMAERRAAAMTCRELQRAHELGTLSTSCDSAYSPITHPRCRAFSSRAGGLLEHSNSDRETAARREQLP